MGLVYSGSFPDPRGHRPVAWVLQLPRSAGGWANSILVGVQTHRTLLLLQDRGILLILLSQHRRQIAVQSGGDPLRGLQDHPWPTGQWSERGWTSMLTKGLEDLTGPSSLGALLFIFILLDGRCEGFSLTSHDCFVTMDIL